MSKQVCIDERGLSALGFCDISAPYAQHQQGLRMQAGLQGVQEVAEEKKQRQFADILHKLTVNNVDQLLGEVQTIDIATPDTLVGFVNQIFNKAVTETTLFVAAAISPVTGKAIMQDMRSIMLEKCQYEYESAFAPPANRAGQSQQLQSGEQAGKALKTRQRGHSTVLLIGSLYKQGMLTEKIVHSCIQELLGDPHLGNAECVIQLLRSPVGDDLRAGKYKILVKTYEERIALLSRGQLQ